MKAKVKKALASILMHSIINLSLRLFLKTLICAWLPAAGAWAQDPFVFHAYIQARFTNQEGRTASRSGARG
jgi:hypothetical protein